ncbi:roadblock/LC7 domain-containing protein [Micromonospora sp. WMMD1120]|uniref:roadblock/LC7 domain-containing protein n=1 Tax=Micromonospora sp. WMMD1120 TaxID=3016106 RepID=UPI002416C8C8|nr:roadblock/LC7 domain-containing protein [Micromonospora sp. WMMD1120]MDG4810690.1 roadblock/LC7 domain-containing protein [Micromonospora sp. WMMD1120]
MTSAVMTDDGLTGALDRMVDRVHGAEFAVLLSPDGLPLGGSRRVEAKLAEQISGVVAGLIALGLAATRTCDSGRLRQVVVQMSRAFLFIATIPNGTILTVRIAGDDVEVGDMAYEVALFVGQAERHLPITLGPASSATIGDAGALQRRR